MTSTEHFSVLIWFYAPQFCYVGSLSPLSEKKLLKPAVHDLPAPNINQSNQ